MNHKHKWHPYFVAEVDLDGEAYVIVRFSCTVRSCEQARFVVAREEEL